MKNYTFIKQNPGEIFTESEISDLYMTEAHSLKQLAKHLKLLDGACKEAKYYRVIDEQVLTVTEALRRRDDLYDIPLKD